MRRLVARIRTDSRRPEEPKDPDTCLVFRLNRQFVTPAEQQQMRERYLAGGLSYAEAKAALGEVIERELGPARRRFEELRADERGLFAILAGGADRARHVAGATIARVRDTVGVAERHEQPHDRRSRATVSTQPPGTLTAP